MTAVLLARLQHRSVHNSAQLVRLQQSALAEPMHVPQLWRLSSMLGGTAAGQARAPILCPKRSSAVWASGGRSAGAAACTSLGHACKACMPKCLSPQRRQTPSLDAGASQAHADALQSKLAGSFERRPCRSHG